jgi:hypothetical protein
MVFLLRFRNRVVRVVFVGLCVLFYRNLVLLFLVLVVCRLVCVGRNFLVSIVPILLWLLDSNRILGIRIRSIGLKRGCIGIGRLLGLSCFHLLI